MVSVVEQMSPNEEQLPAVMDRGRDVVVTAGAGTGKTRTLVARYLSLLADGLPLRTIVAITFTRKAAREMRNRIRAEIRRYLGRPDLDRQAYLHWDGLYNELDAARIGTIHYLCTEILRAHPAEAAIDPRFNVLDEAQAGLLLAQAVDEALAWAADDDRAVALYGLLGEGGLRAVLADMMARRMEVEAAFIGPAGPFDATQEPDSLDGRSQAFLLQDGSEPDLGGRQPEYKAFLTTILERASAAYDHLKQDKQALDFDDLEAMAVGLLLKNPEVLARWQREVAALLVDEYQDTNGRQRDLVNLLNGNGGSLFIVGDAKQSIYRFRGADVAVFRAERKRIEAAGGASYSLARSYRSHQALIEGLNDLLQSVLGDIEDPQRPWREPFSPLAYTRLQPPAGLEAPFIELQLTIGSKSQGALDRAADALARYLVELVERQDGSLNYGHMAVLCRASSSFRAYEDAFDRAGIPYLTIAGRGFFDRPEVRDLLNILRALADPGDDLALLGLLRSPVSGFSDVDLYRLVQAWHKSRASDPGKFGSLWLFLPEWASTSAGRMVSLIDTLHNRAGRTPVADLLKSFLDETDYCAALLRAGYPRAARNVAKLLTDAHASGIVSVPAFLEYVTALLSTAAREGEARSTAGDAIRIMTVHQAKGLEFPIVVIGDINSGSIRVGDLFVEPSLGVFHRRVDEEGSQAALFQRLLETEKDKEAAETDRLFYVAATRAKDKLILHGCARLTTKNRFGWLAGWFKTIAGPLGLTSQTIDYDPQGRQTRRLEARLGQTAVGCTIYEPGYEAARSGLPAPIETPLPGKRSPGLLTPYLSIDQIHEPDDQEGHAPDLPRRVWQVVPDKAGLRAPAWIVGRLVHESLAAWHFPGDNGDSWAALRARHYGLLNEEQIGDTVRQTVRLLNRFREHAFFAEMDSAERRLHEVPYNLVAGGSKLEHGLIDALYLRSGIWTLVDFKTDWVRDSADLQHLLDQKGYLVQAQRYRMAVEHLIGQRPPAVLCLLNFADSIFLEYLA